MIKFASLHSQDRIITYKAVADKVIYNSFDSSILKNIRCKDVSYINQKGLETWSPVYDNKIFERVNHPTVSLTYTFFSKSINDSFSFEISVTKKKNKKMTTSGISDIPNCILTNTDCSFITRDSAINIAIKDSILYPENLSSKFEKRYNKKDYYWVIIGRPISVDSTAGVRRTAFKIPSRSRKYINTRTGELVSWKTYNKP